MSITFIPKRPARVARTAWSYDHGGLDANIDGQHYLGAVHKLLGLPTVEKWDSVPWHATARECRTWAECISTAFAVLRIVMPPYIRAWHDFLATCSGYTVRT